MDRGLLEIFLGSLPQTRRCSRFLTGPGPGRARQPHAHGSSAATARSPHPTGHTCRHRLLSGSVTGKDRKGVSRPSGEAKQILAVPQGREGSLHTGRQTDRQTDRQTHTHTHTHTHTPAESGLKHRTLSPVLRKTVHF